MKKIVTTIISLFYLSFLQAQEHAHEHSRNEIGIGVGALYSFGHEDFGGGMHVHYFRTLSRHSKWSLGSSIEQVWGIESHFNVGAGVKYQLFSRLSVAMLPGVTFFSHNEKEAFQQHEPRKRQFTTHFELIYDLFTWEHFHIGTVIDYSLTKSDSHVALGIHAAFCF
jgi:hypothetical protein